MTVISIVTAPSNVVIIVTIVIYQQSERTINGILPEKK